MAPTPDEPLELNAASVGGEEAHLSGEAEENAGGAGRRLQTGSEGLTRPREQEKDVHLDASTFLHSVVQ